MHMRVENEIKSVFENINVVFLKVLFILKYIKIMFFYFLKINLPFLYFENIAYGKEVWM
jgi:hypothetical protein